MNFSFKYNGVYYDGKNLCKTEKSYLDDDIKITEQRYTVYGIAIDRQLKLYPNGAQYSLTHMLNTTDEKSGIISEICDIDEFYDIQAEEIFLPKGYCGYRKAISKIYRTVGSN